jgi:hypothetical protein
MKVTLRVSPSLLAVQPGRGDKINDNLEPIAVDVRVGHQPRNVVVERCDAIELEIGEGGAKRDAS